ncbi:MAG: glycosyltransferase family 39 protein, partial [Acidobacteriota bacterium]
MFTHARLGHYVPVTWLTHGLDFVLFGMEPRGYHLTSIAFHAADAVLLYLLCCRLGTGAPLVAALFFAVHPLRVESVAWVTARRDVVCGFFVLLCVHAYVSASHRSGRARVSWLAGAIALFVLALLSKGLAMA